MAEIKEIQGNIFDTSCDVIVNTVNCMGVMGKGIALEVKNRFPEVYYAYKQKCRNKEIRIGKLFLWRGSNPWILNFPTKFHWKYPSKLKFIEAGLDDFIKNYKKWGIKHIAFPRLGAESGKLDWEEVRTIIYNKLASLPDLYIEIYQYAPLAISFHDEIYLKLVDRTRNLITIDDYVKKIGIPKKQAAILKNILSENTIKSMRELQMTKWLGKKSVEKIYNFARSEPEDSTKSGEQLELF